MNTKNSEHLRFVKCSLLKNSERKVIKNSERSFL